MLKCSSRDQNIVSPNGLPLRFESGTDLSGLFSLSSPERKSAESPSLSSQQNQLDPDIFVLDRGESLAF